MPNGNWQWQQCSAQNAKCEMQNGSHDSALSSLQQLLIARFSRSPTWGV